MISHVGYILCVFIVFLWEGGACEYVAEEGIAVSWGCIERGIVMMAVQQTYLLTSTAQLHSYHMRLLPASSSSELYHLHISVVPSTARCRSPR